MKAKKVVPQERDPRLKGLKQLKDLPAGGKLPAPLNSEEENLLPYQKLARDLAEVRIRSYMVEEAAHFDGLFWMQYRAIALCDIVTEMATGSSPNECPKEALVTVMGIIREDIEVAQWILRKMPSPFKDRPSRAPGGAA